MKFESRTVPEFWLHFNALPKDVRKRAHEQFSRFVENPRHPSLQLKRVGELWSARVTDSYRALAVLDGDVFTWFWIGPHDEYEQILAN